MVWLSKASLMQDKCAALIRTRGALVRGLAELAPLGLGAPVGANDANFVVVPVLEKDGGASGRPDNVRALKVYKTLAESEGVVVRFRGGEMGCEGCLRITVGSEEETAEVLKKLRELLTVM